MDRSEAANDYVSYLYGLQRVLEAKGTNANRGEKSKARAALARLRRGTGKRPGEVAEMLEHVVPYLREDALRFERRPNEALQGAGPLGDPRPGGYRRQATLEREVFFLVGSLFAEHPTAYEGKENLGDSLRHLGEHESAEKRFVALLNCRPERLGYHLRQVVSLAHSREVPINYRRLLFDLLDWERPDHRVRLSWARSYWRARAEDAGDGAPASDDAKKENP